MRIGVEVGGTFTDLVSLDGDSVRVTKVPSTPSAPDEGALDAIGAAGIDLHRVEEVAHGSTVATNAVLERKGAKVAFVTTLGFRDLLLLQRNDRRRIYDLHYQKSPPLVRRSDCFEVRERVLADGSVTVPIGTDEVIESLVPTLREGGYEAVAVCLVNGYANPVHERVLMTLLSEHLPQVSVTCSCEVTREYREYERASTTTISAYVQPVLKRYLHRFETALLNQQFAGTLGIMQSNGGRARVASMSRNAATALYSGPAAGVIGAVRQVGRSGFGDLITFDMGGTSTDVCLVRDGHPSMNVETEIDGLPVRTPVIDIITVGAGGGSIVRLDEGEVLRVGPQSSAAEPGPACYGRGGDAPTITDAHLVRGTLRDDVLLGNNLKLEVDAARAVFQPLATRMKMSVEQLADSAIRLATSNIVQAIHVVSTERGHDPRDYALVPYGGAGPMHAARVAESLGVGKVVVPPNAGVLSAYGLVASDWVHYETLTRKIPLDDAAPGRVLDTVEELSASIKNHLRETGVSGEVKRSISLYMRFVGQAFELDVPVEDLGVAGSVDQLRERFDRAYERTFLHRAGATRDVEVVSIRVGATVERGAPSGLKVKSDGRHASRRVPVFESGQWLDTRQVPRQSLQCGTTLAGPCVLSDDTSTIHVPGGWTAEHDEHDNLIMLCVGNDR